MINLVGNGNSLFNDPNFLYIISNIPIELIENVTFLQHRLSLKASIRRIFQFGPPIFPQFHGQSTKRTREK